MKTLEYVIISFLLCFLSTCLYDLFKEQAVKYELNLLISAFSTIVSYIFIKPFMK